MGQVGSWPASNRSDLVIRGETRFALVDAQAIAAGTAVTCGIRPEHVELVGPGDAALVGKVVLCERPGDRNLEFVRMGDRDGLLTAKLASGTEPAVGQQVGIRRPPEHCHLFSAGDRACIRTLDTR